MFRVIPPFCGSPTRNLLIFLLTCWSHTVPRLTCGGAGGARSVRSVRCVRSVRSVRLQQLIRVNQPRRRTNACLTVNRVNQRRQILEYLPDRTVNTVRTIAGRSGHPVINLRLQSLDSLRVCFAQFREPKQQRSVPMFSTFSQVHQL